MILVIIYLAVAILTIAGTWRIFEKAGQPGWGCLIPIYNLYLYTVVAQKPGWWTVMFFIPFVNIVFMIMTYHAIAINFGKSAGYTIGMILLPFIFIPMLGLGDAQYNASTTEKN